MENLKIETKGNRVSISFDKDAAGAASKSGKMTLIAQTGGWQEVPGNTGLRFNVMVGKPTQK